MAAAAARALEFPVVSCLPPHEHSTRHSGGEGRRWEGGRSLELEIPGDRLWQHRLAADCARREQGHRHRANLAGGAQVDVRLLSGGRGGRGLSCLAAAPRPCWLLAARWGALSRTHAL